LAGQRAVKLVCPKVVLMAALKVVPLAVSLAGRMVALMADWTAAPTVAYWADLMVA
jgi:hypothetical protein